MKLNPTKCRLELFKLWYILKDYVIHKHKSVGEKFLDWATFEISDLMLLETFVVAKIPFVVIVARLPFVVARQTLLVTRIPFVVARISLLVAKLPFFVATLPFLLLLGYHFKLFPHLVNYVD